MNAGNDSVSISLVAHWAFCPRRAWLEAVGERTDTAQVQSGVSAHKRTDDESTAKRDEIRAVEVHHRGWGVNGRLDTVVESPAGLVIREYKATPVRRRAEVTPAMRTQLALQSACLQDMGQEVAGTEVFFTTHHRNVPVELSDEDHTAARLAVRATREVISAATAPEPLEDDPKCTRCSHAGVCLPDERRLEENARRIVVADPDSQILHLTTPGARASVRSGRLVVTKGDDELISVPIETVQGVQVVGNVDMSSGLLRELLWRRLTVVWCSGTGRVYGWAVPGSGPNGASRVAQHVASAEGRLGLAREFVSAKIANQATQLRRAGDATDRVAAMRAVQRRVQHAARWQDVLGAEGEAAGIYFANWARLIKPRFREEWGWTGRSGRPATDPVNAVLNYGYGLLTSEAIRAIVACGLDPHAGFLHSSGRNKPALALDLMEEFRAPIVDSMVQTVINNGEIRPTEFSASLGTWRMKDTARKAVTVAFERRMQTTIRHPIFGYDVTWRRALEIQARQILGVLDGSQSRYQGIRVR